MEKHTHTYKQQPDVLLLWFLVILSDVLNPHPVVAKWCLYKVLICEFFNEDVWKKRGKVFLALKNIFRYFMDKRKINV